MAQVLVTENYISDIASAIRLKNGKSESYTPSQMASAIQSIVSAGALSIITKSISANGSYSAAEDSADAFSNVIVAVPNSYGAGDEGKVVQSGALVAQSSMLASVNSTYDTTIFDSVVVDVKNSYSAADEGKVVASGALTTQGSLIINANSIYDTTSISQVDVNVAGGSAVLVSKTIVSNGTYNPVDDNADAYSQVVVNVSGGGGGGNVDNYLIMIGLSSGVISDSSITTLNAYAFANRRSEYGYGLTGASFPEVTMISNSAFTGCYELESVYIPKCTHIRSYAFSNCYALQKAEFSQCNIVDNSAFAYCSSLSEISIPECRKLEATAFDNCLRLKSITLYVSYITSSTFRNCKALESVYLLSDSLTSLSNINAFYSTPMSVEGYLGHFGSIYVPSSLVSNYKTANKWSTYANRITAYIEE